MEFAEEDLSQILPARLTPAETRDVLEPVLASRLISTGKGLIHGHSNLPTSRHLRSVEAYIDTLTSDR